MTTDVATVAQQPDFPRTERPILAPREVTREHRDVQPQRETQGIVDVIRNATVTQEAQKVASTTRCMNAFFGYLQNVCGRKLDEITPADTLRLGQMLKALDELEVTDQRGAQRRTSA